MKNDRHRRTPFRLTLASFLVTALAIGTAAGFLLRQLRGAPQFPIDVVKLDDFTADVMWKDVGGDRALLYIVVAPRGTTTHLQAVQWVGSRIPNDHVFLCPEGVFQDGENLVTTPGTIVVMTAAGKCKVATIPPAQARLVNPDNLHRLNKLPIWKQHVVPEIRESAKRLYLVPARGA